MPSPSESEGWDVAHVLQLVNPTTSRWSCPTITKKNRRCENVVSRERSINVTFIIDSMSVVDAQVIVRDHNRELTNLAEMMICPLHIGGADSKEKIQGVVTQWKNYIKTSMRQQAQPSSLHTNTKTPTINCQPINDPQAQHFNESPEAKASVPRRQSRIPRAAPHIPTPQFICPTYGATMNSAERITKAFENLTLQNAQLRDQSKKLRDESKKLRDECTMLRDENVQLRDQSKKLQDENQLLKRRGGAVREIKRASDERKELEKQAEEQFHEIKTLEYQAAGQLERISSLQDDLIDTLRETSSAHSRLSQIWAAASVRPM